MSEFVVILATSHAGVSALAFDVDATASRDIGRVLLVLQAALALQVDIEKLSKEREVRVLFAL